MSDVPFQINSRYRLQWEPAQKCHVLLYPEGLVQLSDTAYEILKYCVSPVTQEELTATLQAAYPDADTLAEDVDEFLKHAFQKEWLKPAGGATGSTPGGGHP